MKIVLRNTTIRQNAVYVIRDDGETLCGYSGRWEHYQAKGLEGLKKQLKGWSSVSKARSLLSSKLRKEYYPVHVHDAPQWVYNQICTFYGGWPTNCTSTDSVDSITPKTPAGPSLADIKIEDSAALAAARQARRDQLEAQARQAELDAEADRKKTRRPNRAALLEL
jgi:hypothetical protein